MHLSVGAEYRNLNIRTAIAEKYKIHIHNMKGDSRFKILSGLLEGRSRFHDNHGITTSHLLKKKHHISFSSFTSYSLLLYNSSDVPLKKFNMLCFHR